MKWTPMIEDVLAAYREYLGRKRGQRGLQWFELLYESNPEAGASEALVFNWPCSIDRNPELHEDPGTGGADFVCRPAPADQFIVEVTCLGREALTKSSGFSATPGQLSFPRSPTKMLRQRVADKADQLSGHGMPQVLAVVSLHDGAPVLLNPEEAFTFFVSDFVLKVPIGEGGDPYHSTDLKNSLFFRFDQDDPTKVIPCRQSVSAVLLIAVSGDSIGVTGALHPEPTHHLPAELIPRVPFLRLNEWPIKDGDMYLEWVVGSPHAASFPIYPSYQMKKA
jgi:hypothetical protein